MESEVCSLDELSDGDDDEDWTENLDLEGNEPIEGNFCDIESQDVKQNVVEKRQNEDSNTDDDDLGLYESSQSQSSQKPVQRMTLNDHKAGMEGLDKEKINKIIFEASKGSRFYENEKKKEKRVAGKIHALKEELATYSEDDFKRAKKAANKYIKEIQNERDLSNVIVHIDMDAFYAAVETRDDPSLKDIPMAVGSLSMLCTSNYAARKYGVRAAMPGFIAKKLCPHLKLVPMHSAKYTSVSNQVRKIIAEYDPKFCGMGLDEAYLNLTDYINSKIRKQNSMPCEGTVFKGTNSVDESEKASFSKVAFNEVGDDIHSDFMNDGAFCQSSSSGNKTGIATDSKEISKEGEDKGIRKMNSNFQAGSSAYASGFQSKNNCTCCMDDQSVHSPKLEETKRTYTQNDSSKMCDKCQLTANDGTNRSDQINSVNEAFADENGQNIWKSKKGSIETFVSQNGGQKFLECKNCRRIGDVEMEFNENPLSSQRSSACTEIQVNKQRIDACDNSMKSAEFRRFLVENIVNEIRTKIFIETKLTASAGIAPNVMLAKVCSDMNKPNGQFYLPPDEESVMTFVRNLPIRKVSGVGRVCEQILNAFGIISCKDLYEKRDLLYLLFSNISFEYFMRISQGIGGTILDNDTERKSMSTETTFSDTNDPGKLFHICQELCRTLSSDLKKENRAGRSITLKMKLTNFEVKTRTKTINSYISSEEDLHLVAKEILKSQISKAFPEKLSLRLLGVRIAEFGHDEKGQNRLDQLFEKAKLKNSANDDKPSSDIQERYQYAGNRNKGKLNRGVSKEFLEQKEEGSAQVALQQSFENQICFESDNILICPVCSHKQPTNTDINKHIDACLNKQVIKEILQQDKNVTKQKSDILDDKDARKTKSSKRKSSDEANASAPTKKKTLLNFWVKNE